MSSSNAHKIEEFVNELRQVNGKMNATIEKLEKELRDLDNPERVNRRRRRNLPAELKVEIVDCLPLENAVHFLANVPSRLIILHCAPRIRAMLKMIDQIVVGYVRTLPKANSHGHIWLMNGHNYTPEIDIFIRYGGAHCRSFYFHRGPARGLVGHPANFFNDLIKHLYETKVPEKAVHRVVIKLPWANPAPWPAALLQPQAGEMDVEELWVDNDGKCVEYILRNKHNPDIAFKLCIEFGKCYQQMTGFDMLIVKNVQCADEIDQIAADYVRTFPVHDHSCIKLKNLHKYTPEMDIFIRYGGAHCRSFYFHRGPARGLVGYPVNFFNDLIKHLYETKVPEKVVNHVRITLPWENPAPWPTALVQPQAGEMNVEEVEVDYAWNWVRYIVRNKHNARFAFKLWIHFDKCYQHMTSFLMEPIQYRAA